MGLHWMVSICKSMYQLYCTTESHSSGSVPCFLGQHLPLELSSWHPFLYQLCHYSPEETEGEQKFIFAAHTGRPLLAQVCHVEPASVAPYAGGAFWVWHTSNRMQAVHCELLCLTSLFLRSSLFSFVVCPFFRHPCTSLLLTRLLRDLQGNLCSLYFPLCITPLSSPPSS